MLTYILETNSCSETFTLSSISVAFQTSAATEALAERAGANRLASAAAPPCPEASEQLIVFLIPQRRFENAEGVSMAPMRISSMTEIASARSRPFGCPLPHFVPNGSGKLWINYKYLAGLRTGVAGNQLRNRKGQTSAAHV